MPKVSIILPTYNGAAHIARAIGSILLQNYSDWELLIIDDGSTDGTAAEVQRLAKKDARIRYIKQETNQGIQKALNRGLKEATGDYIARIDDDDLWIDRDKLEIQVAFLNTHPEYVIVGTGLICRNENDKELFRFLNPETDEQIRARMLYRNCLSHSTVLFRKSAAMQFNGYDESEATRHVEDYDLWLKLGTIGKLVNLSRYAVAYALRDAAISGLNKTTQLKKQMAIAELFKSNYPNYRWLRLKGQVRLGLYRLGGAVVPKSLRYFVMKLYKRG